MKRMMMYCVMLSLAFIACNDDDSQREIDEQKILNYIEENNLDALATGSGLYYVIEEQGSNTRPLPNSTVSVRYTGTFLSGQIFDQSSGTPLTLPLESVIRGWQEGIPLFGRGGKGTLLVPSHLGYGPSGRATIPPNSVLVFDIELVDFN